MLVFVEDSAQAWLSSYVQAGDLLLVSDRWGQWTERAGVRNALVRSVLVVEVLELAQAMNRVHSRAGLSWVVSSASPELILRV
jgi:hypothetical protein